MVFSTSKFESFALRPPTPPKDIEKEVDDALQFLDDPFGTNALLSKPPQRKLFLDTPDNSPSSTGPTGSSSSARRKRVNFEIPSHTHTAGLAPHQWTPLRNSPLRPLPQTRLSQPLKSILKPHDPVLTSPAQEEGAAAHKFQTFAEMLDSVVKLLAKGSRPSKLDAYVSLQRTMQAYEKVPDIQSLQDKIGLLTQFIRRDTTASSPTGKGLDSQLVTQALKLLMVLVRIPELKQGMDDEFCSFMLDRSIQVAAADSEVPKTIINTHLALLMQQNFRPRSMIAGRAEQILEALQGIDKRVSGFSVHAYRLRVYRKLVQQRPDVMKARIESWFQICVLSMLSQQKDIHQSALENAQMAAKVFGPDRQVTKAVLAMFNLEKSEGGDTFGKTFCQQMTKILESSDNAVLVPQIWGTLTPFFRGSFTLEKFHNLDDWLKLLDQFFRSDNLAVKVQANVAYNSMVYAVNVTHSTPEQWSKLLVKLPEEQLQRRNQFSKAQIDSATAGYYALLYYALRQTNRDFAEKELDRYWKEYVADFWHRLITKSPKNTLAACRVAATLFAGSRRPWNELRVLEYKHQPMVHRDELPLLSPAWVRKNLASILKFVETCLDTAPWAADGAEDEPAKAMWISLMDSLVDASSKEVMASADTKDAVAHIINLLRRVWYRHTSTPAMQQQKEKNWADKFCFLIETVLQKLGPEKFVDKFLSRNKNDEFEVAPTPSHRSRQQGTRLSPLLYFIDLIISQSEEKLSDTIRLRVMKLLLEPCLDARKTRSLKLELLKDCIASINPLGKSRAVCDFCERITAFTNACLKDQSLESANQSTSQLGKDCDEVVKILTSGAPHLRNPSVGKDLLTSFVSLVREQAGEGGLVLAVIERLAEAVPKGLLTGYPEATIAYTAIMLNNLPKMITRRTLELGRKSLWPSSSTPARTSEFDPYHHFYKAVVSVADSAYENMTSISLNTLKGFLVALSLSIEQCSISLLGIYLRKTQQSVMVWMDDRRRLLRDKNECSQHAKKEVYREVVNLWRVVLAGITRLPKKDSSVLVALEPLVTSGFTSPRRRIVNMSIKSWNETFGKQDTLRYPSRLELTLRKLHKAVGLSLPNFPRYEDDSESQLSFYESDSDSIDMEACQGPLVKDSPLRVRKHVQSSRLTAQPESSSRRASVRHSSKVRLRHDDSQIHFEPIDSSPTNPLNQESQVLTDRQREMIERQRETANMFSEIQSNADVETKNMKQAQLPELPPDNASSEAQERRTPLKALAPLGPMDVYLGSSPTPHSRSRSQQILSDDTEMNTPTAVRTLQLTEETETPGSSPPHVQEAINPQNEESSPFRDNIEDSFQHGQTGMAPLVFDPDRGYELHSSEFVHTDDALEEDIRENEIPSDIEDIDFSDLPSSTVNVQLTAQINAEIDGQKAEPSKVKPEADTMSIDNYVDAPSQQLFAEGDSSLLDLIGDVSDLTPQQGNRQSPQNPSNTNHAAASLSTSVSNGIATSSVDSSIVGDSFPSSSIAASSLSASQIDNAQGITDSAASTPKEKRRRKKRKQSPTTTTNKTKKLKEEIVEELHMPEPPATQESDDDPLLDCIVVKSSPSVAPSLVTGVTSSGRKPGRPRKRGSDGHAKVNVPLPKRTTRRSQSNLSQMELAEDDVLIEDSPAPKRARKGASEDVSAAKPTPPKPSTTTKRLSHVQVTPKNRKAGSQERAQSAKSRIEPKATETTTAPLETEPSQSQERSEQASISNSQAPEAAATPLRTILTPRSVLGRLRNMLSEFTGMVLGRQEEREFDDVLFEMRRQVHAAGMRGEGAQ